MKKIYLANWIDDGFNEFGQLKKKPDLGTAASLRASICDLGDGTCLVKVSTTPTIHLSITATKKTDAQALAILQAKYPGADLSSMDMPDVEVDELLKALGQNPDDIRRASGNSLKEQEYSAMKKIADLKGKDISDLEIDIKKGKCDAHEKALKRLRK